MTRGRRPRPAARARVLAALAVLAACAEPPAKLAPADAGPTGRDGADAAAGPPPFCEPVRGEPDLGLELVAAGLARPIFLTAPRGDRRLFVAEQHAGRVRVIDRDGELLDEPFVDIGGDIGRALEQGLHGIAFAPDYARAGRFFITYTESGSNRVVLEAWRVSEEDPNRADPDSREALLSVPQETNVHNGGHIHFGPQGDLYMSLGDSGPQLDPEGYAQDRSRLPGSILRLDARAMAGDRPYVIPDDNPFAGQEDAREEIFAYGLRNPWGFGVDPVTGHVFIGDAGFDTREEIDVIPYATGGGQNFGWPILEGSTCVDPGDCDDAGLELPVYEYPNGAGGCAVLGGPVYRGCRMPGHHGRFFFTDFCGGWVRSLSYFRGAEPPGVEVAEWPGLAYDEGYIGGVGRDGFGELYLMGWESGEILRIVPR